MSLRITKAQNGNYTLLITGGSPSGEFSVWTADSTGTQQEEVGTGTFNSDGQATTTIGGLQGQTGYLEAIDAYTGQASGVVQFGGLTSSIWSWLFDYWWVLVLVLAVAVAAVLIKRRGS